MNSWDDHYADLWVLSAESSPAEEHDVLCPGPRSGLMEREREREREMAGVPCPDDGNVCSSVGATLPSPANLATLTQRLTWPHLGRQTPRDRVEN